MHQWGSCIPSFKYWSTPKELRIKLCTTDWSTTQPFISGRMRSQQTSPGHTWGPYGCCNNGEASSFLCGQFVLCASNWSPPPEWSGIKNSNYTPISFMLWFSNIVTNMPGPLIIDWPIDTNHNWEDHSIIQLHVSNFSWAFWMCISFVQHIITVIKLLHETLYVCIDILQFHNVICKLMWKSVFSIMV